MLMFGNDDILLIITSPNSVPAKYFNFKSLTFFWVFLPVIETGHPVGHHVFFFLMTKTGRTHQVTVYQRKVNFLDQWFQ